MNQAKDGSSPTPTKIEESKEIKKDRIRVMNMVTKNVSLDQDYANVKRNEENTVKEIEKRIIETNTIKANTNAALTEQIRSIMVDIKKRKEEIQNNKKSMKQAQHHFEEEEEEIMNDFREKESVILKETKEIQEFLDHYRNWAEQKASLQTRLAELKSKQYQINVQTSEAVEQIHKNEQMRIEKHRIDLAEDIRKARAESLRLRSGDISEQSTTFLTQSEQQVNSLQKQYDSSMHLKKVNENIDDDNMSMNQEIRHLKIRTSRLREQEERQIKVIAKLRTIQQEFADKQLKEKQEKERKKKIEEDNKKKEEEIRKSRIPQPQPEYKMSPEQEQYFTFLTECSTSVRSVLKLILGKDANAPVTPKDDKYEAPKLVAMIGEIKEMTKQLEEKPQSNMREKRAILTPAAAYFAFSAPFDDGDEFIKSENWSFSKYEPCKPTTAKKKPQPRIVKCKAGTKVPIV